MNGNTAMAEAVKQVHPDVVMSYPIMPATPILDVLAGFIASGILDAEFVQTESGVSAISGCIGAIAAGGRVFTASSSQCLASMHEMLLIASSLRLPMVVAITNRALAAPGNINADHSDSMTERDNGWIQLYSENPQEAYDNLIQAYKLAELSTVRTPVFVAMDGFITSHSSEGITIEDTSQIHNFVGKFTPLYSLLDDNSPVTIGSMAMSDYYFEQKIHQFQGIENARLAIKEIGKEFGDRFGRYYGYFESYHLDDAEIAIVVLASTAGTVKESVDRLRETGEKVGLLKLRVFRPFPYLELAETLAHLHGIAVLDRSFAPGSLGGPLFTEVRSALYSLTPSPKVFPYIYGLGGRDIACENIEKIFAEIKDKSQRNEINGDLHPAGTFAGSGDRIGTGYINIRKITEKVIGNGDVGYVNLRK